MAQLDGKKILITGGGRGIGAGIARVLAAQGATVALTYTSSSVACEKVLSGLPGEGHFALQINVNSEDEVTAGISQVIERFGGLDGLVNNAGITRDGLLLRMKKDDFDATYETNLRGAFLTTKAVLKPMMKAKSGSIVNITSVIGQTGNAGQANYAASKAGLIGFTKSVALEVASRNIRANCVAPGFIATEMTEELTDAQKEGILGMVPMKSMGQSEDVAHAVAFLLSDESKYITGHTLNVNGGLHL